MITASSAIGTTMKRSRRRGTHVAQRYARRSGPPARALERDGRLAVEPDHPDQPPDLRLGARSMTARPWARSRWASTARSIISDGSAKRSSDRSTHTSRGVQRSGERAPAQALRVVLSIPLDEKDDLL